MNCPLCGGSTRVVFTDKYDMAVGRVRVCKGCAHTFTTWEKQSDEESLLKPSADRVRKDMEDMTCNP